MAPNTSIYPVAIDGFQQIPLFVDGTSLITADGINRYRSAIVNIETTLGIAPQISDKYEIDFKTVSKRLDFLDGRLIDFEQRLDSLDSEDLDSVVRNGNETSLEIVTGGLTSNGDVTVNGRLYFDTIDAYLNDLNDISIEDLNNGDVLAWNGSIWTSKSLDLNIDEEDVESIVARMFLNDSHNGLSVSYDENIGHIILDDTPEKIEELSNVDDSEPSRGDALIWDGSVWGPGKVSRAALNREEVEDIVGLMFLDAGHVGISAEYIDEDGKIKLKNGIKYIESLYNVSSNVPSNGEVLAWDGMEWKPSSLAPPITQEQIEDIVGLMIGGGVHSGISVDYDDDIGAISITNQHETISSLNDTSINLPSDSQILSYDADDNLWKNVDPPDELLHVRTIDTGDFEGSSGTFSVQDFDDVILCEFIDGGGAVDITLELPNPCSRGREIVIKDKNSIGSGGMLGQTISIRALGGMLIDGSPEFIIDVRNQSITMVCDGSNYWII